MDYKIEAEKYLAILAKKGYNRSQIEEQLGYSNNYIDQQLSKGGNKKFVRSLKGLVDVILQKATVGDVDQQTLNDSGDQDISVRYLIAQQNKLIVSMNKQAETANEILKRMADNVEKKVTEIDTNLIDALGRVDSLKLDLYSGRMVLLQSLARLENKPENSLLAEADNIIAALLDQQKNELNKNYSKHKKRS